MIASLINYIVFFACFGLSFYALSVIKFEDFCKVKQPGKVTLLMFLLSLAYLSSQAILSLTIYNGLGV
jgi:uncharacterized membrane protein YwzB